MKVSQFIEIVDKWFSTIKGKIEEKINGEKEAGNYLHDEVLTEEFTPDLKWDSASVDDAIVAADVVAMDSPLPLKKRGSMGKASGTIAKTGIKKFLNETQITQLNVLKRLGKAVQSIAKLFEDAPKCALGIKERIEMMFLQAISTGATLVEDADNVGVGIRVTFGFLAKNKFGAAVKWGQAGARPMSDVIQVLDVATNITVGWLSKKTFNQMRQSDEGRRLYANYKGIAVVADSILPIPTKAQFMEAFEDEHGVALKLMDREILIEKNGVRHKVKPFDVDTIVFMAQDTNLGRLVYGELAEETNPVEGVKYEKVGNYILLSKYSKNDPLREFTSAQALVLPVIDGVEDIYLLNTQEVVIPEA